jgi:hypothetical protein
MSNVTFQAASRELIAKLVKASYLRGALRHDRMPSRPQLLD